MRRRGIETGGMGRGDEGLKLDGGGKYRIAVLPLPLLCYI